MVAILSFTLAGTNNIRRRLWEHVAHPRAKASIRHIQNMDTTYFSAAPVRPDLTPRVEAFLIRLLHPICNDQVPTAHAAAVNPTTDGGAITRDRR